MPFKGSHAQPQPWRAVPKHTSNDDEVDDDDFNTLLKHQPQTLPDPSSVRHLISESRTASSGTGTSRRSYDPQQQVTQPQPQPQPSHSWSIADYAVTQGGIDPSFLSSQIGELEVPDVYDTSRVEPPKSKRRRECYHGETLEQDFMQKDKSPRIAPSFYQSPAAQAAQAAGIWKPSIHAGGSVASSSLPFPPLSDFGSQWNVDEKPVIEAKPALPYQTTDTSYVPNVLQIIEQPTEHGRFRYYKEGRRTVLGGRTDGTFPTVALTAEYAKKIKDNTLIYPTIVSRHNDGHGVPIPHWHVLEGKHGGNGAVGLQKGAAIFQNLIVNRSPVKRAGEEAKPHTREDQQIIRLMFTIHFRIPKTKGLFTSRVVSDPIYGSELKIQSISHRCVSAVEESEVTFLTSKIVKKNTALLLTDPSPAVFGQIAINGWEIQDGRPTYYLGKNKDDLYIHHQYALVAKIPPFWDADIETSRNIQVQLMDTVQNLTSDPITIEYLPKSKSLSS